MARVPRTRPLAIVLAAALLATGCASTRDRRTAYLQLIHPEQRPPIVGGYAAADSLFGVPEESERGDGIAEARRPGLEALVHRFAPTLVLPSGDAAPQGGRANQLLPTDPRLFGAVLRVDRIAAAPYGMSDSFSVPLGDIGTDSLVALVETSLEYRTHPDEIDVRYFDFPGEGAGEWWKSYARIRAGADSAAWSVPTVWAHPFVETDGRVVVQYWYFYPFNDYLGNHEGDWEHVNVALNASADSVAEVHYFFHERSVRLPQGRYAPSLHDGTHPIVFVGGRANTIVNFPMKILAGDRNSGSHGNFPYAGEWEAAAGLGHTESVSHADGDSLRVVTHDRFRVVLTPEPGRIDYRGHPEVLRDWIWLLLPARWGYPSAPSLGGSIHMTDVGNRAPFGPAFNSGWDRTAPGLGYSSFNLRRVPRVQSYLEDLVQPWYYLFAFRHPRFVHDPRGLLERRELERLGLAPRSGGAERGLGSPLLGTHIGFPRGTFADGYHRSPGISIWRNFWLKARFGSVEFQGGYQRFRRKQGDPGTLFIYPFTASAVLRGPEGRVRPYASVGAGAYGWESRRHLPASDSQLVTSNWSLGGNVGLGIEYYLRPKLALDVSMRLHEAVSPGAVAGVPERRLRFATLWVGHYVRF
jgi:hypothetical protein